MLYIYKYFVKRKKKKIYTRLMGSKSENFFSCENFRHQEIKVDINASSFN